MQRHGLTDLARAQWKAFDFNITESSLLRFGDYFVSLTRELRDPLQSCHVAERSPEAPISCVREQKTKKRGQHTQPVSKDAGGKDEEEARRKDEKDAGGKDEKDAGRKDDCRRQRLLKTNRTDK